jgi:LuxR family maltose regulon positive regulatory protein
MDAVPLLSTKLYAPPPRRELVPRPRLLRRLDDGLQPGVRLVLVSAPAGYGKTTLVSNWLSESGVDAAWLSLDEGDDDPVRFLQYLCAALHSIIPAVQAAPASVQEVQRLPPAMMVNSLINEVAAHRAPFVLVLDDFHVIQAPAVLEILASLLERLPAQMHLMLLSRTDPAVPLSRLRARGQLIDIRAGQLRFTPDETDAFLNGIMGLRLSPGHVAAMEARTEGWIAGLQLAALSMQGADDVAAFVSAFTGSQSYIMDYLVDEVLRLQPEDVCVFLQETSILGRMCGALCDAVVGAGAPGSGPGQAILEALEQKNFFIVPLDGQRRWYRYHHLLADVLGQHLERRSGAQVPELHRRAAQWYEQNGFIAEAAQHALKAGDRPRVARLIDQNGCQLILDGEVAMLLKWLDAIEPEVQQNPWLSVQYAWASSMTGHLDRVEEPLRVAERIIDPLPPAPELQIVRGTIAGARAHRAMMLGETQQAADFARQALECLPDTDPFSRSIRSATVAVLGDASWMSGDLEEARQAYSKALEVGRGAGHANMVVLASTNLAGILVERGRLHEAAGAYGDALAGAAPPGRRVTPWATRIYAGLGGLQYEWNQLDSAAQSIQRCVEMSQQWEDFEPLARGYVMRARLEQTLCHPEAAEAAMQAAQGLAARHAFPPWRSTWIQSALVELRLARGELEDARYVVQKSGISAEDPVPYAREPEYMALLRVLLAQGDREAALRLSDRLLQQAQAAGRSGRAIEVLILQALLFQQSKEPARALALLDAALSLARPEGYVRAFLDEGEPMLHLLSQARAHRLGEGYAAELLLATSRAGSPRSPELPSVHGFVEPLTGREMEVLQLIGSGLTNEDIASRLVISHATVKRHISNIYGKLDVPGRTQAILRARELRLID